MTTFDDYGFESGDGVTNPGRLLRAVELRAQRNSDKIDNVNDRVKKIEETNPAVMASTLQTLVDDVKGLRIALYTFALSVVGGSMLFALTASKLFH